MTYTVTRTYTKSSDSTFWPWENDGYAGGLDDARSSGKLISINLSEDGNTVISTQEWKSESDYVHTIVSKNDDSFELKASLWNTYMALNNISCRIVHPDGSVNVFNPSTKSFESE